MHWRTRIFASIVLSAAAWAAPSPSEAYDVAGWDIQQFPENGPKTGCIMGALYKDGTRLSVIVTREYTWALGFHNSRWKLDPKGTTDTALYVDNAFIASGKATHMSADIALLPLTGAGPYKALQEGRRLDIKTPGGNLNFILTGTAKAMAAVLECVNALNRSAPPPAPQTATASSGSVQLIPQAEAMALVANLLNAAGIAGYRLEPPNPNDAGVTFLLADGTRGLFLASRGNTPSADDHASHVIKTLSDLCKGEFLSGKQNVATSDGSVVRKVVSTCRTADGAQATEATIIRKPNGFLMNLSQVIPVRATLEEATSRDREALVNAAMSLPDAR